ncbi:MAG: flagellar biosynthetic protein FliQ [Alphaproteobacteria bacterium]|nr:flagellar biosynthetic protein FliQ [Alphaproteobacteria bacterium]
MTETEVIEICRDAIMVMFKVSGPILMASLIMGVVISLVQAITHIQEMTVTFVPKIVVTFTLTIWLLPFMFSTLTSFTHMLTDKIVHGGGG